MRTSAVRRALFAGLLGLLAPVLPLRAEPEPMPLQIFDAALNKFEADRVALRPWQYYQTLTTHQLDASGKVVAKGTWQSIVRPGDPRPLEYVSKHVEGHISFFEASAESSSGSKPAASPAASPSAAAAKPSESKTNQAEWAVEAVHKYNLRNRYEWKRLPDEVTAGEEAYVLSFTPKPNQNASTREERFFGHLAGKIWVSQRDFTILRAEGALQAPASLFWVIARVTSFRFAYKAEPVHGGSRLLRLSKANATTVVSFPFYKVRQKHWQTVDKYEPRTPHSH